MSQRVIELDASMFAGRMRRQVERPVAPVRSRGEATYLRKHPIAEVWSPDNMKVTLVRAKKAEPVPLEQISQTQPEAIELITNVKHVEKVDFAARAERWRLDTLSTKEQDKASLVQKLLLAMAVVVFMAGVGVAVQTFFTNRKVVQTVSAQANNAASDNLDEKEPNDDDINSYTVAPNMPRFLTLPKFGTKARVKPVGTDKNNQLQAPPSIFDAGWYRDTVLPGAAGGVSLIDGHVSGPTKPGVFAKLKDLRPGDTVEIERGDGTKFIYKVVKSKTYSAKNMNMTEAMLPVNTAKHGLNLITCTGSVDATGRHYTDRLVVFTELAS